MAFTETQLAALQAALASGVLRVSYDGRSVEYRSVADLERAIGRVKAGLDEQNGTAAPRQVRTFGAKGV